MKKLFIYYSLSNNGNYVATRMREHGYETMFVKPVWNPSNKTFPLMISCGFLAWIGKKMKLENFNPDISKYDQIVIGSPIWNSRLSCPINTVLNTLPLANKNVNFVLYSASGKAKYAIKKIKKLFPNAKILVLKEPKKNVVELDKIKW